MNRPATAALAFLFAVAAAPPALAQDTAAPVMLPWYFVAGAGAIALALLAGLLLVSGRLKRLRQQQRETEASRGTMQEALLAGKAGTFTWSPEEDAAASPGLAAVLGLTRSGRVRFADIVESMHPASAKSLDAAVRRLREDGTSFSVTLVGADGKKYYQAVGKRGGTGGGPGGDWADILWLQDITDRATPLAMLKRETMRLRGLVDALPFPVWARDPTQRLTDVNRAYVDAVEGEKREAVVQEAREIVEAPLINTARSLAKKAIAEQAAKTEAHHIVVGGSRRLFELTEAPVGETMTAGYALDITTLDETRAELERLMNAHADVLERLATAIIIFGRDERVTFYNSAFTHMWELDAFWLDGGPTLAELLDRLKERRMLPETGDFAAFKREWSGWVTSLIEPHSEMLHLPNETAIWMVATPHPMGGLMLTFEDVTDKLTLEREYNTLIAVQRASLDNLYEGVAVFGEDGTLKLSNPIFQHMWGLSDDFLSTEPHITDVVEVAKPYLETKREWPRLKQALVGRVTGRMTRAGRFTRKDGMVVAYGVVPLPDGGVLTSFRDMTDSMRVERALRERNDALEAADRLKSEFVANISYELRTPLNTIIGFTEILNNQYFGSLNERQAEYAEGILEASHRLLALINDILDLAVIEAGRMILEIEELSVRDLLDSVVNLTSEWAREQDLALQMQCPESVGTIEGDERRLKHALFNLISNAIKFTPPGGRIAIGAKRTGDKVAITVADSGIGISAEDQDAVFEKFVRGRGPDGRQLGAGLGLSLVKSFIGLHGGQMALDSMPERGTRVTVWLPVKQLKVEPEEGDAFSALAGEKSTEAAE